MKIFYSLVLYMALALSANSALADFSAIQALREGDMKKLNFHSTPRSVTPRTFEAEDGSSMTLASYQGQYVLLNFWATWCAPCRKEMPMLSALEAELGGDDFRVVTLATGRNPPAVMKKFFSDIGVTNLPLHRDPKQQIARDMGIFGLPITLILDPEGKEIARLQGDADWNSQSAHAIIRALIEAPSES